MIKTQSFETKRPTFQWKKSLWPQFSPIIEHEKVGEQHFKRVPKVFWQLWCKRYHHFFGTLEVDRDKHFRKKNVFRWQKFWPIFLVISSMIYLKEHLARVHKLFLPILCSLPEPFLRPRRLLKSQFFLKKKAIFPVHEIILCLFFRLISSVTNLRGRTVRVQQVFRQILWK